MRFENKIVLITGASRNTGLATVIKYLEEGAFVYLNYLKESELTRAIRTLKKLNLDRYAPIKADISKSDEVKKMFIEIEEKSGRLDILVNNACNLGIGKSFEKTSIKEFLQVVEVNLIGTFQVSFYAVKLMLKNRERRKGVIVNIGSNVTQRAIRNRSAYISSKAGVEALTRSMVVDLSQRGIRVNTISPGYIYTKRWLEISAKDRKRRRKNIPIGYEASTEEIADAILFLTSDEALSINGACLVIDGGCLAQHLPWDIDC